MLEAANDVRAGQLGQICRRCDWHQGGRKSGKTLATNESKRRRSTYRRTHNTFSQFHQAPTSASSLAAGYRRTEPVLKFAGETLRTSSSTFATFAAHRTYIAETETVQAGSSQELSESWLVAVLRMLKRSSALCTCSTVLFRLAGH